MKVIQKFRENEAIPDNAKFLFKEDALDEQDHTIPIYVYEVPVEEPEQLNKVLKTDMKK